MVLAIFKGVVQLPRKIIAMLLAMIGLVVFPIPAIADENTSPANAEPGQAVNPALPIRILITNPDNEPFSGATIRMETAALCRFKVVNNNDQPIEGASVTMWPNPIWFESGSQIVGDGASLRVAFRMSDKQRQLASSEETRRNAFKELGVLSAGRDRSRGTTNGDSISVIRTLPGGSEDTPTAQSIHVFHDSFEQPAGELRRESNIRLRRGQESKITIRMD